MKHIFSYTKSTYMFLLVLFLIPTQSFGRSYYRHSPGSIVRAYKNSSRSVSNTEKTGLKADYKQLLHSKTATARQYISLAKRLFRASKRPSFLRYRSSLRKRYKAFRKNPKRFPRYTRYPYYRYRYGGYRSRYRYRYRSYRTKMHPRWLKDYRFIIFQKNRRTWYNYRKSEWRDWHQKATRSKKRYAKQALRILARCTKRHGTWAHLKYIEGFYTEYGYFSRASRTRKSLALLARGQLPRIEYMYKLTRKTGHHKLFRELLVQSLKQKPRDLQHAQSIATLSYTWALQRYRWANKRYYTKRQKRRQNLCPYILSFLKPALRMPQKDQPDALVMQIQAVARACGHRSVRSKRTYLALEKKMLKSDTGRKELLEAYTLAQYTPGMNKLIPVLFKQNNNKPVQSLTQLKLSQNMTPEMLDFFITRTKKLFKKHSPEYYRVLRFLCQHKATCHSMRFTITKLVKSPKLKPMLLGPVLQKSASHKLTPKLRLSWLNKIYKRYKNQQQVIIWYAKAPNIFRSNKTYERTRGYRYLYRYRYKYYYIRGRRRYKRRRVRYKSYYNYYNYDLPLTQMHRKFVLKALRSFKRSPQDTAFWAHTLKRHLYKISKKPVHARKSFLAKLNAITVRFPTLHQRLVVFYLRNYRYRSLAGKKALAWLIQHPNKENIALITRYYYLHTRNRKKLLLKVVGNVKSPTTLTWLELYAQQNRIPTLGFAALERQLKLRPNDTYLLKRMLNKLEDKEQYAKADKYWFRIHKNSAKHTNIPRLKKFTKYCCADKASLRLAMRRLHVSLQKHGGRKIWPLTLQVLPNMSKKQQETSLRQYAKRTDLSLSQHRQIAAFAYKKQHKAIALQLYSSLARSRAAQALSHQRLAELLDQDAQLGKAREHWQMFFAKSKRYAPTFFEQHAQKEFKQGHTNNATLYYYRYFEAKASGKKRSQRAHRAQIVRLQKASKDLRAWSYWLWSQGVNKAKRCLKSTSSPTDSANMAARVAWKLQSAYRGAILFYPRCHWLLPQARQRQLITSLTKYLRKSKSPIKLLASAEWGVEPDTDFLAQQRAETLQKELVRLGITSKVTVEAYTRKTPCPQHLRTPGTKMSCGQYQRHLAINAEAMPYLLFVGQDADLDGIPDYKDVCPLRVRTRPKPLPKTRYRSRRYRRYYYRRYRSRYSWRRRYYRGRRTRGTQLSRKASYEKKMKLYQKGCPTKTINVLAIKGVKNQEILLTNSIHFYTNRPQLIPYSRRLLKQLGAFLRMHPAYKRIQVSVQAIPRQSRGYYGRYGYRYRPKSYYYKRYRRRYRGKTYTYYRRHYKYTRHSPLPLARERLKQISILLRSYVPAHRLVLVAKQIPGLSSSGSRKVHAKVTFTILPEAGNQQPGGFLQPITQRQKARNRKGS